VIATTSPLVWYTTRATGVVAIVLLTVSVVVGILTTTRAKSRSLPGFAVSELHNRVSLLAAVFVALHVLTAIIDTFVPIGIAAAVVPFASSYRPLPMALGTVAFDLLVAVCISSAFRHHLKAPTWRAIHWLVYASWPLAFIHGLVMGTDLRFGWMQIVSAFCGASVLGATVWRVRAGPHQQGARTALPQNWRRTGPRIARSLPLTASEHRTPPSRRAPATVPPDARPPRTQP
jgi:methionine sulfoxide reductase heme-binding subunit